MTQQLDFQQLVEDQPAAETGPEVCKEVLVPSREWGIGL